MIPWPEIAIGASGLAFSGGWITRGYLQSLFPVRQPRNSIRVANADTDKEVAKQLQTRREIEMELEKKERQHQAEMQYVELEIEERLHKKELEVKALTTGITPDDNALGPLVLSARKALGISQQELAKKAQVKIETVSKIENNLNGYSPAFTTLDLQLIASALDLDYHPPRLTARRLVKR